MPYRWIFFGLFFFHLKLLANPISARCSLKYICDGLRQRQNEYYFYSNPAGFRIPNFQYIKNHGGDRRYADDSFLHPNLFRSEKYWPVFHKAQSRIEDLFLTTKSSLVKILSNYRHRFSDAEYERLFTKLGSVEMAPLLSPEIQKIIPEACSRPNAIYIKALNKMLICPSIMNFPEATLTKVIAHELGHSIQEAQNKFSILKSFPTQQREEVFADWIAAEVLSESLKTSVNPENTALESQMLFLSLACTEPQQPHSNRYPSIKTRVEKIFFARPEFQKALACESTKTAEF